MMILADFGTDISWNGSETELTTVTGDENIIQSVTNRLNTDYNELDWVYSNYGCNYRQFLGVKVTDTALEFIKNSIKKSLDEEERIDSYDLELSYLDGKINIVLNIDGTEFEVNLEE